MRRRFAVRKRLPKFVARIPLEYYYVPKKWYLLSKGCHFQGLFSFSNGGTCFSKPCNTLVVSFLEIGVWCIFPSIPIAPSFFPEAVFHERHWFSLQFNGWPILGGESNLMQMLWSSCSGISPEHSALFGLVIHISWPQPWWKSCRSQLPKTHEFCPWFPGVGPPLSWCYNPSGFFALTGRVSWLDWWVFVVECALELLGGSSHLVSN